MNKKKFRKVAAIQSVLEEYRRFDYDYIPFGDGWTMPDGNYKYRQRGLSLLATGFWRTFLKIFAPVLLKVHYGAKVVGKENLKALGKRGAFCVCNHIDYLDTLFVRAAVGQFRSFHTMGAFNNKKGLGGHIIRHGGMLPLSSNLAATKNLMREMERLLGKGKIINFYAEQAMWISYQKPRPMKEGALLFAVKYNVPVLPVFCTFQRTDRGRMKQLRIHILPAVYADETLSRPTRIADLKARAELAWKECYEKAYGIPLEYLPCKKKNKA